ncbi:SLC13 family permease [Pseudomonas sp. NPDC007930]|uniref:SLC13 family permease n=1 Tax=Pseudomonas sp. NPDC007930 TaxID=3364417 RepID=UPI0036E52D60
MLALLLRPWQLPDFIWPVAAAAALLLFGLLPWPVAGHAVAEGLDVYLFLVGMMLLAEVARHEGLFNWLASHAVRGARGSGQRLFNLLYLVAVGVTVLLSNDATAVVMTPAVYAAARQARVEPLPYLFICAFVANAASFVLPISNPANLVVFGTQMPPLGQWLQRFGLASLAAIVLTYLALRLSQRRHLRLPVAEVPAPAPLSRAGKAAALGLLLTALGLIGVSLLGWALGMPTLLAGLGTLALVAAAQRRWPLAELRGVSWGVLPLVAGLFVLVEAVQRTGLLAALARQLHALALSHPAWAPWLAGLGAALASNLANNLPVGLAAGTLPSLAPLPPSSVAALAVGVDLGPNLSITGSLATLLWLAALRREGLQLSAGRFLLLGAWVMPPALLAALALL